MTDPRNPDDPDTSSGGDKTTDPVVHYAGLGLALGSGMGAAFGAAFGDIATGLGCGVALGLIIGAGIGARMKKQRDGVQ